MNNAVKLLIQQGKNNPLLGGEENKLSLMKIKSGYAHSSL
jgi:hypothetical protein